MSASVSRPRLLTTTVAAVLSGVVLLSGCSGGDSTGASGDTGASDTAASPQAEEAAAEETGPYAGMEPVEVLTLVQEKANAAKSVRMRLKATEGEDQVTVNVSMNRKGRATATLDTGADGSMKLVRIGKKGWILPGKDMLASIAEGDKEMEQYMQGKWLEMDPEDPDSASNFDLTDMDTVLKEYVGSSTPAEGIALVEGKKFGKVETIGLTDEGVAGTMYIAADGSGELVALVEDEGTTRFSEWNKKVKVKKPTNILETE